MTTNVKQPEFATNDPESGSTVAGEINAMLAFYSKFADRSVAIASAFFNVGGWSLLAEQLEQVPRVRILLGAEPQRQTDPIVLRPEHLPRKRAGRAAITEALSAQEQELTAERDLVPFTPEARGQVQQMITWLRSGRVEVRRYTREFLHGKAYLIDNPALGVIAGSSNMTFAGLSRNRELNLGQYSPHTMGQVRRWFDGLWVEADAFDLAGFYEQQVLPEQPWLVFLRMLWEAYGHQMLADEESVAADPSMRNLLPFQKDGVGRARRILEQHSGVLIADEVGLGKTFVGGALVKDTVRARQRVLIVAPKIIRDNVWKPYVDAQHLAGWVDVISYDDLIAEPNLDGRRWRLDVARSPDEYSMVLLDEAHTVRNTDTNRAKALVEVLRGNPRKQVVLLTATPVNNSLGDLHSLLSYFIVHDDEFADIGIPSLAGHFRAADRLNPDDLAPEHLFDILDAVAVRRTRRFVRQHYVGQRIDDTGAALVFPEPVVQRVDYDLAGLLEGFFDAFAHALGADRDPDEPDLFFAGEIPDEGLSSLDPTRLTLAGYQPTRYLVQDADADRRQRAAEVQVAGLLRSGLLKRFESSGAAFVSTCRKMASTLSGLVSMIEEQRLVASGEALRDYVRLDTDDFDALDDWLSWAETTPLAEFHADPLLKDIRSDIALLQQMAATVESSVTPASDPKLEALRETLAEVLAQAEEDARHRAGAVLNPDPVAQAARDRDDRKVLVFSYFADTIHYLQDNIDLVLSDPRLEPYRGRVAFVTGTRRAVPGLTSVSQDEAVAGFAPRTTLPPQVLASMSQPDQFDLLFATDVLSEGVNLQQAHNVANYDLPWNPMRLVQRHGRVDRIGSQHAYIHLYCFFPDQGLDRLLNLEAILHRKLTKAAKSIGQGEVLPGVAGSDDVVFNAKQDQIRDIATGDNAIFLGVGGGLISGEEFRALLRQAIENESLEKRLQAMPWGIGSGFTADDRAPGLVFCARILNRDDEPVFRYLPLPTALLPGESDTSTPTDPPDTPTGSEWPPRPAIDGIPVDVISESLTALTVANPPSTKTEAHLPQQWVDLAYKGWEVARQDIAETWNGALDPAAGQQALPVALREALRHLGLHGSHRHREDIDNAIKIFRRGQSTRVTQIVRGVMRDQALTDRNKTDRLIELIDELGLVAPESRAKRYAIHPDDVHLIAWMAIVPQSPTTLSGDTSKP